VYHFRLHSPDPWIILTFHEALAAYMRLICADALIVNSTLSSYNAGTR
jgi:hypothetical protein